MQSSFSDLAPILDAFGFEPTAVERVQTGLINETFRIESRGATYALQRLNPIFAPRVHEDIDAVTRHLESKGVVTPRIVPTRDGSLWIERTEMPRAGVWRALTWIDGRNVDRLSNADDAYAAGELLGRFHAALADLEWTFRARRLGVHDTPRQMTNLETALSQHRGHRLFAEVEPLALDALEKLRALPSLVGLGERIVHGDPKITNVLFERNGPKARALIDLDTVAPMAVPLELGDAFRSWCNPGGEDSNEVRFDLQLFEAGLRGYASSARSVLRRDEVDAIAPAIATICLELSTRFLADALNESYFGWNANKYASRGDHNLLRGRGQLLLGSDYLKSLSAASAVVEKAFT